MSRAEAKIPCTCSRRRRKIEALKDTVALRPVLGLSTEFVVGDDAFGKCALDAHIGPVGLGEILLERCADQVLRGCSRSCGTSARLRR